MTRFLRAARGLALSALLVAVLTACSEERQAVPSAPMPHVDPLQVDTYVAMGDSFSSGPGIDPLKDGGDVCLRSVRNYPSVLAERLNVPTFDDVTCAGASIGHILTAVPIDLTREVPAQRDAIEPGTDLITFGIGYNDNTLITNLLLLCTLPKDPKGACAEFVKEEMPPLLESLESELADLAITLRRTSPDATVMLVGYLSLVSGSERCPLLDPTPLNARLLARAEASVESTQRAAAKVAGISFVPMRTLSKGHEACAGRQAWVNGGTATPGDGVEAHPNAAGMRAVADAIADQLADEHAAS